MKTNKIIAVALLVAVSGVVHAFAPSPKPPLQTKKKRIASMEVVEKYKAAEAACLKKDAKLEGPALRECVDKLVKAKQ